MTQKLITLMWRVKIYSGPWIKLSPSPTDSTQATRDTWYGSDILASVVGELISNFAAAEAGHNF